jgi:uncharacterized protein YaeQ
MALGATLYHFQIDLSDVDRGVYQALDLRVARHPSETLRFMLARVIAYGLCFEEGIAFSKGGLSNTEEPALSIRDASGNLRACIEVGSPSAERLHKASKGAPRLVVFTHHDPALLKKVAGERPIHRAAEIEAYALPPALLDALEAVTERHTKWVMVHTAGELYVTVGDQTVTGAVTRFGLADEE